MSSQIDQLRSIFNIMSVAQKKVFIDNLKQQIKGVNNPEYTKFLNECVAKHAMETLHNQKSRQAPPVGRKSPARTAFCGNCGVAHQVGDLFCGNCGGKI